MTASPPRSLSRLVSARSLPYKTDMISANAVQDTALALIRQHAGEGTRLRARFFEEFGPTLRQAARLMAAALAAGGKILICGNGGSAADAQHIAAELVNRFLLDRPALPAVALTTDSSILTSVGNDFGFELIFARQVEALGAAGDVLLVISTSGNSPNALAAAEAARQRGMSVVGLTGEGGGRLKPLCDILLAVPHPQTPLVQEIHITVGHLVCRLIDYYLFENPAALRSDDGAATA